MALHPRSTLPAPYDQATSHANTSVSLALTLDPTNLQPTMTSRSTSPRCSSIESMDHITPTPSSFGADLDSCEADAPTATRHRGSAPTSASSNHGGGSAAIQRSRPKGAKIQHRSAQEARRRQAARMDKHQRARSVAVRVTKPGQSPSSGDDLCSAKATNESFRTQAFINGMGRPESIVHLRAILLQAKESGVRRAGHRSAQTFAEAFLMLESRDEAVSFTVLQQFQDAMVLYERLRQETSQQSSDRFQLVTPEIFDRPGPRRPGNRKNLQKFDISAALLKEVAPDLLESSSEYEKKRAKAKEFCECGRRLASMAERFGRVSTCLALVASDVEREITNWRRHVSVWSISISEYMS